MQMEIKKERETPLLSRKRTTCMVEYEGATPSRLEFRKAVSSKLKAPEELTIIKHIYTRFGQNKAKVIAHIYKSKEDMQMIEEDYLLKKHQRKQEAEEGKEQPQAKEEKPAEAGKEDSEQGQDKAEGKPAEDNKEEAPAGGAEDEKPAEESKE